MFLPSVVARLSLLRFYNRPQNRHDVNPLTLSPAGSVYIFPFRVSVFGLHKGALFVPFEQSYDFGSVIYSVCSLSLIHI